MNIIITGCCGFVGSALCLFLKKNLKNSKILSIDNLSKNYSKFNQKILNKNKIKNKKIDLGNSNSFNKINFKADYIIDCSAEPAVEISKKKTVKVIESNFLSTVNILQKVKKDNSKLIFISSSRVYPITESYKKFKRYKKLRKHLPYKEESNFNDTKTIYGFTKYCSEHLIKEYNYSENTKFIINRCGLISGPGQYGKVEQGLVALWMWRHINKMNVSYLGHGGNGTALLVCIPITVSTENSEGSVLLNQIISQTQRLAPNSGDTAVLTTSGFNLNKLVPRTEFYFYEGTLPFEPCTGNYGIIVFKKNAFATIMPKTAVGLSKLITPSNITTKPGTSYLPSSV